MPGTMRTASTVFRVFICLAFWLSAPRSARPQQASAKEVVERFCKLNAEENRLSLDGQKEVEELLYEQKPWTQPAEITVVRDHIVRASEVQGDKAQVVVDYNEWGRLDSSFHFTHFTPLAELSENHPIAVREYISLIRSDKHREVASNGQWHDVQDVLAWRIKTLPSSLHVNISAAMRYVREIGLRSKDTLVRRNAQVALAELSALYQTRFQQLTDPRQSPSEVLAQFIALQTEGKGLTVQGQEELDALLIQPAAWGTDKIHVTRDFVVSNAAFNGDKGGLYVEFIALGDLDSSLRFTSGVPGGIKVREGYTLVLSNKYSLPGRGGKPAQEFVGPNRWKIAAFPTEKWFTVNTAIRYVTEMRDKTTDATIKQNASETLAKLRTLE